MLQRKLDPPAFRLIDDLIEELEEHRGNLAPSPLFNVRVVRSTLRHASRASVRNPLHSVSLARLATLLVPHIPARTPYEAKRAILLEGEAYYEYASALFRCGRNYDAQRAADESRRLFDIPIVRNVSGKKLAKLDLTYGHIVFNLGEIDRGLEMVCRAADRLHIIYGDTHAFLVGRTWYGALLIYLRRWEDALIAYDEILQIADETHHREIRAAITYNISICGKRLQEEHADRCHAEAMKLLEENDMSEEVPGRAEWIRIIELQQQGKGNDAISELYKIRAEYFKAGLDLRAHDDISPNIVDALIAARRFTEARAVGEEAIAKLAEAGLKRSEHRIRRALDGSAAA